MAELPATISEAEMIDTVAHWFDLFTKLLTTESSRLYTQIWLKRLVRQGTIPTVRVIQWANEGHADADIALRQVVAEMLDQSERPPATIAGRERAPREWRRESGRALRGPGSTHGS